MTQTSIETLRAIRLLLSHLPPEERNEVLESLLDYETRPSSPTPSPDWDVWNDSRPPLLPQETGPNQPPTEEQANRILEKIQHAPRLRATRPRPRKSARRSPMSPRHLRPSVRHALWETVEGKSIWALRTGRTSPDKGLTHLLENGTAITWINKTSLIAFPKPTATDKEPEPILFPSVGDPIPASKARLFAGRITVQPLRKNLKKWITHVAHRAEKHEAMGTTAKHWRINPGSLFRYTMHKDVPSIASTYRIAKALGMRFETLVRLLAAKGSTKWELENLTQAPAKKTG